MLVVRLLAHPAGPLELSLPATPRSVPIARHRLRTWLGASAAGLDRMVRSDLELAWSEACTNAVRHAYGSREATFSATANLEPTAVSLEVRDQGEWREPRGGQGGRGLPIMRQVCDEVVIERGSAGTTVRMRCRLDAAPSQVDVDLVS
jgi:anti-sigma regulatory factor (Ser/Thr protein kinase)